ncbi:MAG: hypothetical protein K0R66_383 [Gammaproteobacteria bacterium]|jgi:G:T/U-mismatch repair DNA glycosylase|nr:hypothetical protein [Gammaproteobacteria bacterium]
MKGPELYKALKELLAEIETARERREELQVLLETWYFKIVANNLPLEELAEAFIEADADQSGSSETVNARAALNRILNDKIAANITTQDKFKAIKTAGIAHRKAAVILSSSEDERPNRNSQDSSVVKAAIQEYEAAKFRSLKTTAIFTAVVGASTGLGTLAGCAVVAAVSAKSLVAGLAVVAATATMLWPVFVAAAALLAVAAVTYAVYSYKSRPSKQASAELTNQARRESIGPLNCSVNNAAEAVSPAAQAKVEPVAVELVHDTSVDALMAQAEQAAAAYATARRVSDLNTRSKSVGGSFALPRSPVDTRAFDLFRSQYENDHRNNEAFNKLNAFDKARFIKDEYLKQADTYNTASPVRAFNLRSVSACAAAPR